MLRWTWLALIGLLSLNLLAMTVKVKADYTQVSGANFYMTFSNGQSLRFQNDVTSYLTIQVSSGLLNATTDTLSIGEGGGYLTFTALNETQLNITYTTGISSARIQGHNGTIDPIPIERTGTLAYINTGNSVLIQWDRVLAEYVPFMFILGMIGLVALMGSPIYGVYAVRKRDRNQIVTALIMGCLGFGLFIGWLWGV